MDKATIEKKIARFERITKSDAPADEKAFSEKKLKSLKIELESLIANYNKKTPKKETPKKETPKKEDDKLKVTYKGKEYSEDDKDFCSILIRKMEDRKSKAKKANRKYKTLSISERIGGDVADSVVKAVKAVEKKEIDLHKKGKGTKSATLLARLSRVEKSAKTFLSSFSALLSEEYNDDEIKEPLKAVESAVSELQRIIEKKKKK